MKDMKKISKTIAVLISVAIFLSGCGNQNAKTNDVNYEFEKTLEAGYPVQSDKELSWWCPIYAHVTSLYGNLGDTPFAKELTEATGINVKYIHPPAGQENTQFNILLSSGDLPDIISVFWTNYANGGAVGAIKDKVIIPINQILDNGGAPALKAVLDEEPEWKKMLITDEGLIPGFPGVAAKALSTYSGFMVRKDYLDKVGKEVPETIGELEEVLRAFKNELGIKIPISFSFIHADQVVTLESGFGIGSRYYIEDGKVKYGPAEDKYYNFLETLNRWYNEGLFDNEFTSAGKRVTSQFINGEIGIVHGTNGSMFGNLVPATKEVNPEAELVAMPYMTEEKGTKPKFGHQDNLFMGGMACITTQCQDIELAAKLLDYGFTEKGKYLADFGKEGRDWIMGEDGRPKLTESMTNPDLNGGQSVSYALGQHSGSGFVIMPKVASEDLIFEFYNLEEQKNNSVVWRDTEFSKHLMPALQYSNEESQEIAQLQTAIDTYKEEMLYKFVSGVEPLSKWEEYRTTIEKLGLPRALEIMQSAYDRFMARK